MAHMIVPLQSIESSIYSEVFHTVANDVSKMLKLHEKTELVMFNSMEVVRTDLRNNVTLGNEENRARLADLRRLECRVTNDFDSDRFDTEIIHRAKNDPIFIDNSLEVSIEPIYLGHRLEFNFTYTSTKSDIEQVRDGIRIHLNKGLNYGNHTVEYTMILPHFIEYFMDTIYSHRNRLWPIDRRTYFTQHATNRIHLLTDMSNKGNTQLAVRERQVEVIGFFEYTDEPPKESADNSQNQHTVEFTYVVNVELPKSLTLDFQPIVANKRLPLEFITPLRDLNRGQVDRYVRQVEYIGRNNNIIHSFGTDRESTNRARYPYPINIPDYDYFKNPPMLGAYSPILTVLVEVEEEDCQTLFNLKDMDPWGFSPAIYEYLKDPDNRKRVCTFYASFIFIGLSQSGRYFNHDAITIDEDLNVKATTKLDLHRPVRVIISGMTDLVYMEENCLQDIMDDDALFEMFLREYFELKRAWPDHNNTPSEVSTEHLCRILFQKLLHHLDFNERESARSLIRLVMTDNTTSRAMAEHLKLGFRNTHQRLASMGIATITRNGLLQVLNGNESDREKLSLAKQHIYHTDSLYGGRLPKATQILDRDKLDLGLMRTQMHYFFIDYKGEQ